MTDRPFRLALALGRLLLEPRDVERMLLPTLADAHYELGPRPSFGARLALLLRVVAIAWAASGGRIRDAVRETSWWPLGTAVLAGIAGALGLEHSAAGHRFALAHVGFVAAGACAAFVLVVVSPRTERRLGILASVAAAAALVWLPWHGELFDGVRRWIRLGPLTVHVTVLLLPLLVEWQLRLARGRRVGRHLLVVAVVCSSLGAAPDLPALAVFGAAVIATARRRARDAAVLLLVTGAALFAATRPVLVSPIGHVEGALGPLAGGAGVWFATGLAAAASTLLLTVVSWLSSVPRSGVDRTLAHDRMAAAAVGLVSLAVVPWLLADGAIPWLSFGGSALFAAFLWVALGLRLRRQARVSFGGGRAGVAMT